MSSYKSIAPPDSKGNMRLLSKYGGGSKGPRQSYPPGYAHGGKVRPVCRADGGAVDMDTSVDGMSASPRLDRPGRKMKGDKGSRTNVNVIVMPGGPNSNGPMPPMGAPMPMPPPPSPPSAMAAPPPGGPPIPMRKSGGRVTKMGKKRADGGGVSDYMRDRAKDKAMDAGFSYAMGVPGAIVSALDADPVATALMGVPAAGMAARGAKALKDRREFLRSEKDWKGTGMPDRASEQDRRDARDNKAPSMGRAKGGKVHSDEKQDRALFKKMMAQEEKKMPKCRARGGVVDMDAGAGGAKGRLEKIREYGK